MKRDVTTAFADIIYSFPYRFDKHARFTAQDATYLLKRASVEYTKATIELEKLFNDGKISRKRYITTSCKLESTFADFTRKVKEQEA